MIHQKIDFPRPTRANYDSNSRDGTLIKYLNLQRGITGTDSSKLGKSAKSGNRVTEIEDDFYSSLSSPRSKANRDVRTAEKQLLIIEPVKGSQDFHFPKLP